jgi:hypothetical protein
MKISQSILFNLTLVATSYYLTALASAVPCEDTDEPVCIAEHKSCGEDPEGCCDGLGCFGYNFYKSCKKPPACLDEWNDCSSGMDCCDGKVCAVTHLGAFECQTKTIITKVAEFHAPIIIAEFVDSTTMVPTAAPHEPIREINLKTTKIPNQPVTTTVACSVGDPHM